MPTDEERINRLENAVFGDDSSGGVLTRIVRIENELGHMNKTLDSISQNIGRLVWIIVTAVLVGLLGLVINRPSGGGGGGSHNSTSVNVGKSDNSLPADAAAQSRGYLLVKDIAAKHSVAESTVRLWIEENRFLPPAVKRGKEWTFDLDAKLLPQDGADCGKIAQNAPADVQPTIGPP